MAADQHGDQVTSYNDKIRPPLACTDLAFHEPHPHTLSEDREVHGATFPKGLSVWCKGKLRSGFCGEPLVHVSHQWKAYSHDSDSDGETLECEGVKNAPPMAVHGFMTRPGALGGPTRVFPELKTEVPREESPVLRQISEGKLAPMSFGIPQQLSAPSNISDDWCGSNDVHLQHTLSNGRMCIGVDVAGVGLFMRDGKLDPYPEHPELFDAGVLPPPSREEPTVSLVNNAGVPYVDIQDLKFSPNDFPILGICDRNGRSLIEFILLADGRLDVKYYNDDVTAGVVHFVAELRRMYGRGRDV